MNIEPVKTLRDEVAINTLAALIQIQATNHTNIFKRILNFIGVGGGYKDVSINISNLVKKSYEIADSFLKEKNISE